MKLIFFIVFEEPNIQITTEDSHISHENQVYEKCIDMFVHRIETIKQYSNFEEMSRFT